MPKKGKKKKKVLPNCIRIEYGPYWQCSRLVHNPQRILNVSSR
jgi:hypothetical protein